MIPTLLPTYARAPFAFERGEGSWLWDTEGRRYLDFAAGIAVCALGHAHPGLVAALTEQAGKLWHTSNLYQVPQQQALADALTEATFADTVFMTNSGTESMELAVKMARRYWHSAGRPERTSIVAFEGSFHGRSSAAIAAAGSEKLTAGFGPLLPGFVHLPFGDHEALRAAMAAPEVGAVIVEPIQGEGGIRPLPDACLKGLRDLCDEKDALMILDEVQCGMGRTGRLFAHEWAGIAPDILLVAKGIGGGFPIGAVLATEAAGAPMTAGSHGSTYGGNPLGCAVALKVLETIAAPAFLDEVGRKAGLFRQALEGLVAAHPDVFDGVRGAGLMLGLRCKVPPAEVVAAGYAQGLLTVPAADNVVRLLPALTIAEEEIVEGVARLDRAASGLSKTGAA